jgi:hypothetical protein
MRIDSITTTDEDGLFHIRVHRRSISVSPSTAYLPANVFSLHSFFQSHASSLLTVYTRINAWGKKRKERRKERGRASQRKGKAVREDGT